jgi:hypothetical protein
MSQIKIHKVNTTSYTLQTKQFNGKKHIIAPVVMMVEGVHSGSKGAIFHSIEELGKFPNTWDGMPVVVKHPIDAQGNYISANALDVAESCIGRVYNTRVEGKKLKADVYIDEDHAKKLSPTALAYIHQGKQLEVSVGVFTDSIAQEGEWEGEAYTEVAINHRPDHLALLPGETGACSWTDGCGIRNNQQVNNPQTNTNNMTEINVNSPTTLRQLSAQGIRVEIMAHAVGLMQRLETMGRAIAAKDTEDVYNYMEELYDDHVIWRQRKEKGNEPAVLYKQTYNVHADGTIELTGEPVKVRKEVNYLTVNSINNNQNQRGMSKQNDDQKSTCFLAKVDKLIANEASKFTADDKDWLLQQDEAVLDKLIPDTPPATAPPKPVEVNADHIKAAMKNVKTSDEFLGLMPDGLRDQMRSALTLHENHRKNLVGRITAHAKDVWPEEDLHKMETAMLERIANTASAKAAEDGDGQGFYLGSPAPQVNTSEETEVLMPLI